MVEKEYFSVLMLGHEFGLIEKDEIIRLADIKISEREHPEYWLIELSIDGSSGELPLLHSNQVIRAVLSMAYKKWTELRMSNWEFTKSLRKIWTINGSHSVWYVGIENDLVLIHDGLPKREDHIKNICTKIKKLIG